MHILPLSHTFEAMGAARRSAGARRPLGSFSCSQPLPVLVELTASCCWLASELVWLCWLAGAVSSGCSTKDGGMWLFCLSQLFGLLLPESQACWCTCYGVCPSSCTSLACCVPKSNTLHADTAARQHGVSSTQPTSALCVNAGTDRTEEARGQPVQALPCKSTHIARYIAPGVGGCCNRRAGCSDTHTHPSVLTPQG